MTDQIDTVLRDAGDRWRRDAGPMPSLDRLLPPSPPAQRHRAVLPALVAAAIVAAIAVAVTVTRGPRSSGPAEPGPSTAAPAGLCQDAFTARADISNKGDVVTQLQLLLTNVGPAPCAISAYGPHIDVVDAGGDVLDRGWDTSAVRRTSDQLTVAPKQAARMSIAWLSYCSSAEPDALVLHLDADADLGTNGVRVALGDHRAPRCEPGSGGVAFHYGYPTTEEPSDPCAGLALTVATGSDVTPVPVRPAAPTHIDAVAPVHLVANETGGCSDQVGASVWRDGDDQPLGQTDESWDITTPGRYELRFMKPMCPPQPQMPQCLGGIALLATVTITVS